MTETTFLKGTLKGSVTEVLFRSDCSALIPRALFGPITTGSTDCDGFVAVCERARKGRVTVLRERARTHARAALAFDAEAEKLLATALKLKPVQATKALARLAELHAKAQKARETEANVLKSLLNET